MSEKQIAQNKKAWHEYFVEEKYEAGMVLSGAEVKSLRIGNANISDAYVVINSGRAVLVNAYIAPYEKGSYYNLPPRRDRELLLHKTEITKLAVKVEKKGYTLIPLRMYFKEALIKLEIGVCKGKQLHDKRQAEADKTSEMENRRILKEGL